jgi:3-deoxy-D-manno-octulosonic-acid transferase
LKEAEAIKVVKDADEFIPALDALLQSSELRKTMGDRGHTWVMQSQGAVRRTMGMIESVLDSSTINYANQPNGALQR